MAKDPSYVRLPNRLSRGIVADLNSGWSIAGLDVQKFPEDPAQARFVRTALNNGKLEPSSRAEYDDAHDDDEAMLEATVRQYPEFGNSPQEAKVRRAHAEAQAKLEARRGDQRDPEEVYDEEVRQPRKQRANALPDDLDELSRRELQDLAKRRGVSAGGTNDEIIARLEADSEEEEEDSEEE